MSRPLRFRRSRFIFQFPSSRTYRPEDRIVMVKICEECRKPLTNKQIRHGNRYCSYKCSNRAKGRARVGTKHKRRFKHNLTSM